MADVVAVARLEQLALGQGMMVTVRGVPVALLNVEGTVDAIADLCRHAGVSLGSGERRGTIVRCRAHGWRYDVTTGHTMHDPAERVTRDPVQVVDGANMANTSFTSLGS